MSTPEEVLKLVTESGHTFHAKVARWLQAQGWRVAISPYYMDPSQNKAREIDIVAEKLWPVRDIWNQGNVGDVAVRLFVECKFVPSYSVFWFTEKDRDAAEQLVCSLGYFRQDNSYTAKHHYLAHSARVAKLFASSSGRNSDNDPFFKALNQVLNAAVSMRGAPVTHPEPRKRGRTPMALLEFPVVVCSSFAQMYSVDFFSDSIPERIEDNFQLEVQYAYLDRGGAHRNEYLLLDFVQFDKLQMFSTSIDEDAQAAAYLVGPT